MTLMPGFTVRVCHLFGAGDRRRRVTSSLGRSSASGGLAGVGSPRRTSLSATLPAATPPSGCPPPSSGDCGDPTGSGEGGGARGSLDGVVGCWGSVISLPFRRPAGVKESDDFDAWFHGQGVPPFRRGRQPSAPSEHGILAESASADFPDTTGSASGHQGRGYLNCHDNDRPWRAASIDQPPEVDPTHLTKSLRRPNLRSQSRAEVSTTPLAPRSDSSRLIR